MNKNVLKNYEQINVLYTIENVTMFYLYLFI